MLVLNVWGFSSICLNVNLSKNIVKILTTQEEMEREKEFPYEVCKGCVVPDCVYHYPKEGSPKLNSSPTTLKYLNKFGEDHGGQHSNDFYQGGYI